MLWGNLWGSAWESTVTMSKPLKTNTTTSPLNVLSSALSRLTAISEGRR
jgi:hypothetical protein